MIIWITYEIHTINNLTPPKAPYPTTRAEPGAPTDKTHFGRFNPQPRSFAHNPEFMFILFTAAFAPFCLSISQYILPSLKNKTPRYLN